MNHKKLPYLKVNIGDEVLEIETNRLGRVSRFCFGSKCAFAVTWLDTGESTIFSSRESHQKIKKTGVNFFDSDSDSDSD